MTKEKEIVLFETEDKNIVLPVMIEKESVWLSLDQMAELFQRDRSVIGKHVQKIFKEGELVKNSVWAKFAHTADDGKKYQVDYYNLDVIISVGYRVKSVRGTQFRIWANSVLKQYILQGYAVNQKRMQQLGEVIRIMKRTEDALDSKQILSVVERYSDTLDLLDAYDHQTLKRPKGNEATYVLAYEECMEVIKQMRFGDESDLFGKEKDDSFKGSLGNIYQTYGGKEVYESLEEKAANLLYFVTKNHSFYDGNKRIAATMFLHFLDKNDALIIDGRQRIDNMALVALTIMIAESRADEKEVMISVVINCLK